jgi:hypothetical protein
MPAKNAESRLIDALSSLKRAAHIENLRDMPDHLNEGNCFVFTSSKESMELLENVLAQALSSNHTPDYWRKHPGQGVQEEIESRIIEDWGIFEISFPASDNTCQMLAERIEDYAKNLTDPDRIKRSR